MKKKKPDSSESKKVAAVVVQTQSPRSSVGRPSKFFSHFCDDLKDHMKKGYSFESFAAVIGVNRDTLYEWANVHAEFDEAKKDGHELALFFFEKLGMEAMQGNVFGFPAGPWIFTMKARFKWNDRPDLDQTAARREFEDAFEEAAKAVDERRKLKSA